MKNLVLVDKGALQLALNVLERSGKMEVAEELRAACRDPDEILEIFLRLKEEGDECE